ncbi:YibE/F family protein, partial [human gut metagenome]
AEGASLATARVTATQVSSCAESAASLGGISDGSLLGDAVCAEITSGEGRGLVVPVHVPAESLPAAQVGDRMRVMYTAQALAGGTPYVFVDYDRQLPVGALAVAYLVLVVAVAGLK